MMFTTNPRAKIQGNIMEIHEKIKNLKKEKKAIILAHNYISLEVQKIADIVGDSFQLARAAKEIEANIILFCGVTFMAETAKLLNPSTKVLLSNINASCPMADMAEAADLKRFKEAHPSHLIVCYVNSTVAVKALSDVCVTSSNAVKIVEKLPKETPIMFVPDQNLGTYVQKKTNRKIDLWDGFCPIHHLNITLDDIYKARDIFPDHSIIVHPECRPEIIELADFVGSTKQLLDYSEEHDRVIIGTEIGLIRMLQDKYPQKSIHALSERAECVNMKKTTLDDVYHTLLYETNEIFISPDISEKALLPIEKMLELG